VVKCGQNITQTETIFYFTHRLAKDSKFHIQKILNISWTFRHCLNNYMGKILFVFKRFRVQNFVWILRVEIFILNFSRCLVLLASSYMANTFILFRGFPLVHLRFYWSITKAVFCAAILLSPFVGHVVKHGLDSLVKHGLDPISKTWTLLVKHGLY
jgi:hypothetical protein